MKHLSVLKMVSLFIAFLMGVLCSQLIGWFSAGIVRPSNIWKKSIPIEAASISQKDRWILNYQLSAVYLEEVDSSREYILLIIKPKEVVKISELPDSPTSFVISGLAQSDYTLVFGISPLDLKKHPDAEFTKVLNLPAEFFGRKRAYLTESLKVSSESLSEK